MAARGGLSKRLENHSAKLSKRNMLVIWGDNLGMLNLSWAAAVDYGWPNFRYPPRISCDQLETARYWRGICRLLRTRLGIADAEALCELGSWMRIPGLRRN
jgi:hypothetical protein